MIYQFRVYPDRKKSPQFYKVFIFPSRAAMYAFRKEQHRLGLVYRGRYDWKGMTCHWGVDPGLKCKNHVGQVLLYKNSFGAGVIAHEMTHAALYWLMARRRSVVPMKRLDEPLAWMVGNLTAQFWRAFWKHGLDKKG